eukprot:PhM_4_TR11606/c0_g1_i1/m.60702/K08498/STX6; syntaxin 6
MSVPRSEVLQGEVVKKLAAAQSALRTVSTGQHSANSVGAAAEAAVVFESALSSAREMLVELQGLSKSDRPEAAALVGFVTSSTRRVMVLEDQYASATKGRGAVAGSSAASTSRSPYDVASTHSLMLDQQRVLRDQQEQNLGQIEAGVTRLRHTAVAINDELSEQHGMLDTLDNEVDGTREKLRAAANKLDKVMTEMSDRGKVCCIVVLMFILGVLIAILVAT